MATETIAPATTLHEIAGAMVQPGKGILAADESTGTIKSRFDAIGVEIVRVDELVELGLPQD